MASKGPINGILRMSLYQEMCAADKLREGKATAGVTSFSALCDVVAIEGAFHLCASCVRFSMLESFR